jgi:hypothetical protein
MNEYFKNQIEQGAEMFYYGLQSEEPLTIRLRQHKGSLDSFPTNLEYVRQLSNDWPLFKEVV